MEPFTFFLTVSLITISGALSPGPLTIALIISSAKRGVMAGLETAIGHTLVELPLAYLIFIGLLSLSNVGGRLIAFIGGIVLIIYGLLGLKGGKAKDVKMKAYRGLYIGVLFTAFNPYFIIWWLTIGLALTSLAIESFGSASFLFMYTSHVWLDYAWLISLAFVAHKGISMFKDKYYEYTTKAFGLVLILFGILFLLYSVGVNVL
jgi:threonine/homoserine/homoserine lactone efflux protein